MKEKEPITAIPAFTATATAGEKKKVCGFPKYQWSFFTDSHRSSQIVVRANHALELEQAIKKVLPIITKVNSVNKIVEETEQASKVEAHQPELTVSCEVHNVPMVRQVSKKGNEYWSHKGVDGRICFGQGYLEKKY